MYFRGCFCTSSSELHERISKIDKLKKRYEIITVSMQPPEDEEEHSQAYYVIKVPPIQHTVRILHQTSSPLPSPPLPSLPSKAAQQREELQRKGDDLDAKIRKAEKEIRALENTLRLMNSKNENYRQSLTRVDKSGDIKNMHVMYMYIAYVVIHVQCTTICLLVGT